MALNLNFMIASGRLGKDSEERAMQTGQHVVSFSIFVVSKLSRDTGGNWQEEGMWLDVDYWTRQNETIPQFRKGEEVVVSGRLRERQFTTKDGRDVRVVSLVADKVRPVNSQKTEQTQQQNAGGYGQQAPKNYAAPAPQGYGQPQTEPPRQKVQRQLPLPPAPPPPPQYAPAPIVDESDVPDNMPF